MLENKKNVTCWSSELEAAAEHARDQRRSLMTKMYSALVLVIYSYDSTRGFFFVHERRGSRCQSLVWSCSSLRGQRSLQASAAFLLEPFVLASAPSAFLEPLGRPAVTAVVAVVGFVSEQTP